MPVFNMVHIQDSISYKMRGEKNDDDKPNGIWSIIDVLILDEQSDYVYYYWWTVAGFFLLCTIIDASLLCCDTWSCPWYWFLSDCYCCHYYCSKYHVLYCWTIVQTVVAVWNTMVDYNVHGVINLSSFVCVALFSFFYLLLS